MPLFTFIFYTYLRAFSLFYAKPEIAHITIYRPYFVSMRLLCYTLSGLTDLIDFD
jgi:hypothetical protein